MDYFKKVCRLHTNDIIYHYLVSNTISPDGANKAYFHSELCKFYVAAIFNINHVDNVRVHRELEYKKLH